MKTFINDLKMLFNQDKSKVKPINKINYLIITWFFKLYWISDILFLWLLYAITDNQIIMVLLLLSIGYNIYYFYKFYCGRSKARTNLSCYRVQGAKGPQGIGKSSFNFSLAKLLSKSCPIYCNNSALINNKFIFKLSKKAFEMETKLEQKSVQVVQELSILYNNLAKDKDRNSIAGSEANFQFVRHNTNGWILCDSVELDRAIKTLEEKFGMCNQILEQRSIKTGFLIPFIYWLVRLFNKKLPHIFWGYRRWKIQTFLKINQDGYIYDLSNDDAKKNNDKFVNLYYYYDFNDYSIVYDDRTYSKLYQTLPSEEKKQFKNLSFSEEDAKDTGFTSLLDAYDIEQNYRLNKSQKQKQFVNEEKL